MNVKELNNKDLLSYFRDSIVPRDPGPWSVKQYKDSKEELLNRLEKVSDYEDIIKYKEAWDFLVKYNIDAVKNKYPYMVVPSSLRSENDNKRILSFVYTGTPALIFSLYFKDFNDDCRHSFIDFGAQQAIQGFNKLTCKCPFEHSIHPLSVSVMQPLTVSVDLEHEKKITSVQSKDIFWCGECNDFYFERELKNLAEGDQHESKT